MEFAFTHSSKQYGEEYYSFVNGQHTTQGGTHQAAFREAIVRTIREFYNKDFETSDIRTSIAAAISIKVQEPVFESQTKTKLGSQYMEPGGQTIRNYVNDHCQTQIWTNYLALKIRETAEACTRKILAIAKRTAKEWAGIKNLGTWKAWKKASLHNKKLRGLPHTLQFKS